MSAGIPLPAERRAAPGFRFSEFDWQVILLAGDVLTLFAAFLVACAVRVGAEGKQSTLPEWIQIGILILIWIAVAPATGSFRVRRSVSVLEGAQTGARSAALASIAYLLTPFVSADVSRRRSSEIALLILTSTLIALWRLVAAKLRQMRRYRQPVLIIGAGWAGGMLQALLDTQLRAEYQLVGYLDDDPAKIGCQFGGVAVLAPTSDLQSIAAAHGVSEVFLALPHYADASVAPAVIAAYESGIRITPMTEIYEAATGQVPMKHIGSYWYTDLPLTHWPSGLTFALKRSTDVIGALAGLTVMAILLAPLSAAIKLSSRGSIFYRQDRVGRLGKVFQLLKFRTMIMNAEPEGRALLALPRDSRVTRMGRFLRKSRLDELPQFWNVLKGEMSLVGPRPERPEVAARVEERLPAFRSRLLVKPGLSGWAQVNMSYASTEEEMLPKLQYDLYYIKHWSIFLDIAIVVRTLAVIARLGGT